MGAPAVEAAAACRSFARHFFASVDDEVQQYVVESLLAAAEGANHVRELAETFEAFLPSSCSRQALSEGLCQLDSLLLQPGQQQHQQCVSWLQQPGPPAAPLPAAAATSSGERQPAASGGSGLSIGAAEFKPAAPAASLGAGLESLHMGGGGGGDGGDGGDGWDDVEGAAEGDSYQDGRQDKDWQYNDWQYNDNGSNFGAAAGAGIQYHQSSDHHSQHAAMWPAAGSEGVAASAGEEEAEAGWQLPAGGPAAEAASLGVLADQFPLFSEQALRQLFLEAGGSLAATIHTLCSLEEELQGQQQQHAASSSSSWQAEGDGSSGSGGGGASGMTAATPAFTDDDFPTLGLGGDGRQSKQSSTTAGTAAASWQGAATTGKYASKARPAAGLPSQPSRPGGASNTRQAVPGTGGTAGARSAAAAAATPIWRQEEGVQRFATGAAVAQEYAQLRADARDHARLRNTYFQQATQAYLTGNRRLAKELGAKGRWHGEQMQVAHQGAASQLFAQRNPGAAGGARGGGGDGGGGVQTVDLHGLHVSEALQQLESLLFKAQGGSGRQQQRRLRVVVGVGQHGKVPARLPAAVARYLQQQGVAFTEPYAGMLEIKL